MRGGGGDEQFERNNRSAFLEMDIDFFGWWRVELCMVGID